jgi:hypothetical protein
MGETEVVNHRLKILFAVRSPAGAADFKFLSFDQRRYGNILFQTYTSKIDFRNPRFHVLQFSHYFSPPPPCCSACSL